MVDYRALLKDTIRGTIWDLDVPSSPASLDANGEPVDTSREALEAFWSLVHEVVAEGGGESREFVRRHLADLERQDLGELPS